jgi:hypothetical protein
MQGTRIFWLNVIHLQGYEWNRGGSSANPCSEAYMGPEAFAAVETKLMADFVASRKHALMYIDFHSYSQLCKVYTLTALHYHMFLTIC